MEELPEDPQELRDLGGTLAHQVSVAAALLNLVVHELNQRHEASAKQDSPPQQQEEAQANGDQ